MTYLDNVDNEKYISSFNVKFSLEEDYLDDIAYEGVVGNIFKYIILLIRKVASYIKSIFYKIFSAARRYKVALLMARRKFVKVTKNMAKDKFASVECSNILPKDKCWGFIFACSNLLAKTGNEFNKVANNVSITKGTIGSISNVEALASVDVLHISTKEANEAIAGKNFTYKELEFNKEALIEDINKNQKDNAKLSEAGYDINAVLEIFAKSTFCCDSIMKIKAAVEYSNKKLEMAYNTYKGNAENRAYKSNAVDVTKTQGVVAACKVLNSLAKVVFSCAYGIISNVYAQLKSITKYVASAN